MRPHGLVLTTLLLASAPAVAQQTPPAAPAAPAAPTQADQTLDRYLQRWELEMKKVQTLAAQMSRVDKDKTFQTSQKFTGYAQYMKAGSGSSALNLAALEMKLDGRPEVAEKFICTGTYLYQFLPAQKEVRAYELPKPRPGRVGEDSFLGFLFGMRAEEARRRYVLKLAKEDQWYVYVDITPRFPQDKSDFQRARIVLNRDSFLPRQLWFEHPNGNEVTWDIPRIQSGVRLDRRTFDAPQAPAGWKLVPVRRDTQVPPRVIRQGPNP